MAPGKLINPDGSPMGADDDSLTDQSAAASDGHGSVSQNDGESGGGSIQTDESWKEAAAKEKEKLDEEAREAPPREMPKASFMTMLSDFGFQAMMALGLIGPEGQKERMVDLQAAKFVIDSLGVLEEKTKGNLTDEEAETLQDMVQSLRMRFVEVSKLVAAYQTRQEQPPVPEGPLPPGGGGEPSAGGAAPGSGGGIILE